MTYSFALHNEENKVFFYDEAGSLTATCDSGFATTVGHVMSLCASRAGTVWAVFDTLSVGTVYLSETQGDYAAIADWRGAADVRLDTDYPEFWNWYGSDPTYDGAIFLDFQHSLKFLADAGAIRLELKTGIPAPSSYATADAGAGVTTARFRQKFRVATGSGNIYTWALPGLYSPSHTVDAVYDAAAEKWELQYDGLNDPSPAAMSLASLVDREISQELHVDLDSGTTFRCKLIVDGVTVRERLLDMGDAKITEFNGTWRFYGSVPGDQFNLGAWSVGTETEPFSTLIEIDPSDGSVIQLHATSLRLLETPQARRQIAELADGNFLASHDGELWHVAIPSGTVTSVTDAGILGGDDLADTDLDFDINQAGTYLIVTKGADLILVEIATGTRTTIKTFDSSVSWPKWLSDCSILVQTDYDNGSGQFTVGDVIRVGMNGSIIRTYTYDKTEYQDQEGMYQFTANLAANRLWIHLEWDQNPDFDESSALEIINLATGASVSSIKSLITTDVDEDLSAAAVAPDFSPYPDCAVASRVQFAPQIIY